MVLFQQNIVWKSIDSRSPVRYFCFQNLENSKYCVQSADFIHLPVDSQQLKQFEMQAVELFIEVSPLERAEWFDSLQEAISAHDIEFQ